MRCVLIKQALLLCNRQLCEQVSRLSKHRRTKFEEYVLGYTHPTRKRCNQAHEWDPSFHTRTLWKFTTAKYLLDNPANLRSNVQSMYRRKEQEVGVEPKTSRSWVFSASTKRGHGRFSSRYGVQKIGWRRPNAVMLYVMHASGIRWPKSHDAVFKRALYYHSRRW